MQLFLKALARSLLTSTGVSHARRMIHSKQSEKGADDDSSNVAHSSRGRAVRDGSMVFKAVI